MGLEHFKAIQNSIAQRAVRTDAIGDVQKIAGFDLTYFKDQAVCTAIVLDATTLRVLERKFMLSPISAPYEPGFLAFREGPPILQLYHDLENEPDVLMIDGHGIAHPRKCGLATYVGVELDKPSIGVAKDLLAGTVNNGMIILGNDTVGAMLKTHRYGRPLCISPGHAISVKTAMTIVKQCIVPPHKLPEPIHRAHRYAKQILDRLRSGEMKASEDTIPAAVDYNDLKVGIDA